MGETDSDLPTSNCPHSPFSFVFMKSGSYFGAQQKEGAPEWSKEIQMVPFYAQIDHTEV